MSSGNRAKLSDEHVRVSDAVGLLTCCSQST